MAAEITKSVRMSGKSLRTTNTRLPNIGLFCKRAQTLSTGTRAMNFHVEPGDWRTRSPRWSEATIATGREGYPKTTILGLDIRWSFGGFSAWCVLQVRLSFLRVGLAKSGCAGVFRRTLVRLSKCPQLSTCGSHLEIDDMGLC